MVKLMISILLVTLAFALVHSSRFGWEELQIDSSRNAGMFYKLNGTLASKIVRKPVFISITTISLRIRKLHTTLWSLLTGPVIPDRIYVFVSKEPFLVDEGIEPEDIYKIRPLYELLQNYPISVVYTENIGPHRKLLPLLDKLWDTDCLIATFDDEPKYWLGNYLRQLISYYQAGNESSVVTLKARRFSFCSVPPYKVLPYSGWGEASFGMHEFFLLPTGTGGVLYRPRFFHPIVFDREFINKTKTTDDLAFRLGTMISKVFVITGCRETARHETEVSKHGSTLSRVCESQAIVTPSKSFQKMALSLHLQPSSTTAATTTATTTTATEGRRLLLDFDSWHNYSSVLSDSASSSSSLESGRRRQLADKGLYGTFNKQKGNDRSFYAAYFHLHALGLLNLEIMAREILNLEREDCFRKSLDSTMPFPGGSVGCMISKCRKPAYSKNSLKML